MGTDGIGIFPDAAGIGAAIGARHIGHVVRLAGIDHAGIGLGHAFDIEALGARVEAHPGTFPPAEGYAAGLRLVAPEQLPQIAAEPRRPG